MTTTWFSHFECYSVRLAESERDNDSECENKSRTMCILEYLLTQNAHIDKSSNTQTLCSTQTL